MTWEQLGNNVSFRRKLNSGLLSLDKCRIYDNFILLYDNNASLYVLLDMNYNTIAIEHNNGEDREEFVKKLYSKYSDYKGIELFENKLGCMNQKFTLKQIIELSNRTIVSEYNHGRTLNTMMNGVFITDKVDDIYLKIISYIKFLSCVIEQYYLTVNHMKIIGFEYVDIYSYLNSFIKKLNECVDIYIKNNKRPSAVDIMKYVGQIYFNSDINLTLVYDVVDMMMYEKGYKVVSAKSNSIEMIDSSLMNDDLSLMFLELLDLSKLSSEELNDFFSRENRLSLSRKK